MDPIRVAVVGAGSFGRNHMRVLRELPGATLAAVVDADGARAAEAAASFQCPAVKLADLSAVADAAVVAVPTVAHSAVGCALMEAGLDVLVEKPIAPSLDAAQGLLDAAEANSRVLQVGHLERFNPAVTALRNALTLPLFFEIHRMSVFTPRSLDVDVVLDLMIHDLDIVLSLVGEMPEEIRAAGISVLSEKVDIANVRLSFAGGCVANVTASRVSTERVRKLRLFQPRQYISLDYARQEAAAFEVSGNRKIGFRMLSAEKAEPLRLELEAFTNAVRRRSEPPVTGRDAYRALAVALDILDKIEEHSRRVEQSVAAWNS